MSDSEIHTLRRDADTPPSPSPAPTRKHRDVALNFWFGPKKIAAVKLHVEVEDWTPDLAGEAFSRGPDLGRLTAGADGVYRPSEPISSAEPALSVSGSALRYVERGFRRGFIDLTTDFESYLAKFSGKSRSTLKRKARKLDKVSGGKIDWRTYRTASEMDQFHGLAKDVSRLTYQEKLFDAGIPADPAFVRDMRARADADAVRGFILFLDGTPISYLYLPIEDGRVIYGFLGFDPSHSKLSPGTVLQMLALESLCSERRYRLFDFTEGDGAHKRFFSTEGRLCGNVFYLKRTVRNSIIVRGHLALSRISARTERLVERSGVKTRLKQLLRGQFSKS